MGEGSGKELDTNREGGRQTTKDSKIQGQTEGGWGLGERENGLWALRRALVGMSTGCCM